VGVDEVLDVDELLDDSPDELLLDEDSPFFA
jgi:hypothetical protein